eukprot:1632537-Rhodomonas_salina.1
MPSRHPRCSQNEAECWNPSCRSETQPAPLADGKDREKASLGSSRRKALLPSSQDRAQLAYAPP